MWGVGERRSRAHVAGDGRGANGIPVLRSEQGIDDVVLQEDASIDACNIMGTGDRDASGRNMAVSRCYIHLWHQQPTLHACPQHTRRKSDEYNK